MSEIDEVATLLDGLERPEPTAGTPVIYRRVAPDEVVEDSLPSEELDGGEVPLDHASPPHDFVTSRPVPLAAVDSGTAQLGETPEGVVLALRAAVVSDQRIALFRTGPLYLRYDRRLQILHQLGCHLGQPGFFVELEEGRPVALKRGAADDAPRYVDRLRSWLERLVQMVAVRSLENGVVLFDGALTLSTHDTPRLYLERLAAEASNHGNAVVAVSKESLLEVEGRSVAFWLADAPERPCYRLMTPSKRRSLGNVYAARFSALGPTLRMDVKPAEGQSDEEAISLFYTSALIRGGYLDVLVRARALSYFTFPAIVQLQAQAGARFGLRPQREPVLSGVFGPFAGRYK